MDIEKTMEFILEHQARHATAIQQLDEGLAQAKGLIEANAGMIRQLVDVSMSLARHSEEIDTDLKETRQLIRELRESQAHSDRRLDALIDVVEKLTRRNGGAA